MQTIIEWEVSITIFFPFCPNCYLGSSGLNFISKQEVQHITVFGDPVMFCAQCLQQNWLQDFCGKRAATPETKTNPSTSQNTSRTGTDMQKELSFDSTQDVVTLGLSNIVVMSLA